MIPTRLSLSPIFVAFLLLGLAACASLGPGPDVAAPAPGMAPPPANIAAADLVGSWGLAAYHKPDDRARTEAAARGQCSKPYVISRGPSGGVMMHLADATQPRELVLKAGTDGKAYVGPEGPAPDVADREIASFDGRVMILRWVDPEVAGRYGTMVFVRCGVPGAPPVAKKKSVRPS
jgi:hypothetical protein